MPPKSIKNGFVPKVQYKSHGKQHSVPNQYIIRCGICDHSSTLNGWLICWVIGVHLHQNVYPIGEKPRFSTMILTMFQLHFEVENVPSNYKMFFSTQNDVFNCLPKQLTMLSWTHNIVESYFHMSIFQPTLRWQDFSWKWQTIVIDRTFLTFGWSSSTFI